MKNSQKARQTYRQAKGPTFRNAIRQKERHINRELREITE